VSRLETAGYKLPGCKKWWISLVVAADRGVTTNGTELCAKGITLSRKRPEAGKFQRAEDDVPADFNKVPFLAAGRNSAAPKRVQEKDGIS
jgi:hypothetical protein